MTNVSRVSFTWPIEVMAEDEDDDTDEELGNDVDFFDQEPSLAAKIEMRKTSKRPSEWLKLLCREWAAENEAVVDNTDAKFMEYKPFLKGLISSQLLCRLSMPHDVSMSLDFWDVLGVADDFDRAYIASQVERFGSLFCISGPLIQEDTSPVNDGNNPAALSSATIFTSPNGSLVDLSSSLMDFDVSVDTANESSPPNLASKKRIVLKTRSGAIVGDTDDRRNPIEKGEQRNSESYAAIKAQEHADREASREERRRQKLEIRIERNRFARQQKEAAMRRAAELVASNRVPIEITRGVAAARAAEARIKAETKTIPEPTTEQAAKTRSAIVVSTANDLNQIVTHAKNLYAKYSAIAREHNQRVSWGTIARDLGIHVKVRQKYSRMHSRAEQRNFDWQRNGHWKIKDHPEIFLEPTDAERKAKMPPPPPDEAKTVLIGEPSNADEANHHFENSVSNATSCAEDDESSEGRETDDDHSSTLVQDPTTGYSFSV